LRLRLGIDVAAVIPGGVESNVAFPSPSGGSDQSGFFVTDGIQIFLQNTG